MNGKPGDHPITDLMFITSPYMESRSTPSFGSLESLCHISDFAIGFSRYWSAPAEQLQPLVAAKLEELRRDAQERGWENVP